MQYKQNLHVLLPVKEFEELRELGHKLSCSKSEIVREGVGLVLRKYQKKENLKERIND